MKIIFHYGIHGEILQKGKFVTLPPFWNEEFNSIKSFYLKYGVPLVCSFGDEYSYIYEISENGKISHTLNKENDIRNNLIRLSKGNKASFVNSCFRIQYYYNSLRFHLILLANSYLNTSFRFNKHHLSNNMAISLEDTKSFVNRTNNILPWLRSIPLSKVQWSSLTTEFTGIFYIMIDYLVSARILLDSLIPIFNCHPSLKLKGGSSRSFNKFIKRINNINPTNEIIKYICISYKDFIQYLIEYRDCALHYNNLSTSNLPHSMIIHSGTEVVALLNRLPDNPEVRSIKKYKYNNNIEYLSYAHNIFLKMTNFILYILNNV